MAGTKPNAGLILASIRQSEFIGYIVLVCVSIEGGVAVYS